MKQFGKFFAAIWADSLTRMSGPLSVPFVFAALYLDSKYAKTSFAALAIVAALTTAYRVWAKEYDRAETETEKNEAAPHMDIEWENIIPRGQLEQGVTDLFFNVRLVLAEPSHLSISNFTLDIFDDVSSRKFTETEDMSDWDLTAMKDDYYRRPVKPITKELTTRGDPVRGWVHFHIGGFAEGVLGKCSLTFKVNARHGTCYRHIVGSDVLGAIGRGLVMMKKPQTAELIPSSRVP